MFDTWQTGPRAFNAVAGQQNTEAKDERTMTDKLKEQARALQRRVSELKGQRDLAQLEVSMTGARDDVLAAIIADLEAQIEPLTTERARLIAGHMRRESGETWEIKVTAYCKENALDDRDADCRMSAVKAMLKTGELHESELLAEV